MKIIVIVSFTVLLASCGEHFLDVKRDRKQVVPFLVSHYQGVLDHSIALTSGSSHELGVIGGDEYRLSLDNWTLLARPYQRNGHVWAEEIHEGAASPDWDQAYQRIQLANMVLDGLARIDADQMGKADYRNAKGSALFFRAMNHYQVAQLFCKPFMARTAALDPGIPLRLDGDVTVKSRRASVADTYGSITADLREAVETLPDRPLIKTRPSRVAALAMLARVYLQMSEYGQAGGFADRALGLTDGLLDFNALDADARYPFTTDVERNPEVLFACSMNNIPITGISRFDAAPDLLEGYVAGDLRERLYFFDHASGRRVFKGSYTGGATFFTGLATDEVLLIRAECRARTGMLTEALSDLNLLRSHRFEPGHFRPLGSGDAGEVLDMVLAERRRELLLRGVRWEDIRRLNQDAERARRLERHLDGRVFTLLPSGAGYVWPIPDGEIKLSGIPQNER